jgi:hypothetical protein
MIELTIDRLRLVVDNAAGHEHRLEVVARLAASLVADRLAQEAPGPASTPRLDGPLATPTVSVNFSVMTDAVAAERIAGAWLAALAPLAARPGRPAEVRR